MKKLNYILVLVCILTLNACQQIVELDFEEHEPLLTVNALFEADSTWQVSVSLSKGIVDTNNIQTVNNATVEIYENDVLLETLSPVSFQDTVYNNFGLPETFTKTYYQSEERAKAGKTYRIVVQADGHESVEASSALPNVVPISNIELSNPELTVMDEYSLTLTGNVNITFEDSAAVENYYAIRMFAIFEDSLFEWDEFGNMYFVGTEPFVQRIYYNSNDLSAEEYSREDQLYADQLFDGQSKTINHTIEHAYFGSKNSTNHHLVVQLLHVSKDYFLYEKSYTAQLYTTGDPFSEPTFVYNNIKNGYGIFGGFSSEYKIVPLE